MKKLVKVEKSIENLSEESVHAFCDHDGCDGNCKIDTHWGCLSDGDSNSDDDILF